MDCGNRALQIVQRSIIKPPGALHLHSLSHATQNHLNGPNCFFSSFFLSRQNAAFANLPEENQKVESGKSKEKAFP
jgi:hypothetical protein